MQAFELADLALRRSAQARPYLEFLRERSLSMGLYVLPEGGSDPQRPHAEDEVYVVMRGRARIRVGDEDRDVEPGSIVFVAANVPHHFHTLHSELHVLVFFAPAETPAPAR